MRKAPALGELTVLPGKVRDENRRMCMGLGEAGRGVTRTGGSGKAFQKRSCVHFHSQLRCQAPRIEQLPKRGEHLLSWSLILAGEQVERETTGKPQIRVYQMAGSRSKTLKKDQETENDRGWQCYFREGWNDI